MSVNVNPQEVIASKDVVVHDDNLNIDRKLFAGQPVPPDLVEAYQKETGEKPEPKADGESSESASARRGGRKES